MCIQRVVDLRCAAHCLLACVSSSHQTKECTHCTAIITSAHAHARACTCTCIRTSTSTSTRTRTRTSTKRNEANRSTKRTCKFWLCRVNVCQVSGLVQLKQVGFLVGSGQVGDQLVTDGTHPGRIANQLLHQTVRVRRCCFVFGCQLLDVRCTRSPTITGNLCFQDLRKVLHIPHQRKEQTDKSGVGDTYNTNAMCRETQRRSGVCGRRYCQAK